jgi:hypothetical protein
MGLNGHPMPDEKPQLQDESGEAPEETYIDAFSRDLRHSVSDVYTSLADSLLPLTVRRDVTQLSWSRRSGLRPDEWPNLPFGPGWSSNLCSYVRVENTPRGVKALVVDEQGGQQTFLALAPPFWAKPREDMREPRTAYDRLEGYLSEAGSAVQPLTMKKKFGSTCIYEAVPSLVQTISADRISGSDSQTTYRYYRLSKVTDRWGNELHYTYPPRPEVNVQLASDTLIPRLISDPKRPGHQIQIEQQGGHVTRVRTPDGQDISYGYSLLSPSYPVTGGTGTLDGAPDAPFPVLTSVQRGGATVEYDYTVKLEQKDPQINHVKPAPPFIPVTRYLALNSIKDERGLVYHFEWEIMHHLFSQAYREDILTTNIQLGQPMCLTRVSTNVGTSLQISAIRNDVMHGLDVLCPVSPIITRFAYDDGVLNTPNLWHEYSFSGMQLLEMGQIGLMTEDPHHKTAVVRYSSLSIASTVTEGGPGIFEYYTFNSEAGMALDCATDASGNTTNSARWLAASAIKRQIFSVVATGSNATLLSCTTATLTCDFIGSPLVCLFRVNLTPNPLTAWRVKPRIHPSLRRLAVELEPRVHADIGQRVAPLVLGAERGEGIVVIGFDV